MPIHRIFKTSESKSEITVTPVTIMKFCFLFDVKVWGKKNSDSKVKAYTHTHSQITEFNLQSIEE